MFRRRYRVVYHQHHEDRGPHYTVETTRLGLLWRELSGWNFRQEDAMERARILYYGSPKPQVLAYFPPHPTKGPS